MMDLFSFGWSDKLISHVVSVRTLATGSFDKTVKLWDLTKLQRASDEDNP